MPSPLGWQHDVEYETAVGELRLRARPLDGQHELAAEVVVRVRRAQLAPGAEPAGIQLASPDDLTSLDVEDVGEVRHDRDLDRESNGPGREVLEVVVLVDAVRDRAIEPHAERLAFDGAVGVDQRVVGELEARRERLDGTRAEKDRPRAVDP